MSPHPTYDLPRELLVLRHAKSSWDSPGLDDFDRPLAGRGKRDSPRIGAWLHERELVPDFVVSSPAKRARQTARRVVRALGLPRDVVELDDRVYEASTRMLLEVIQDRPPEARRMLIVGHNPSMEGLVRTLASNASALRPGGVKLFPTATLAHFLDGDLVEIVRPRSLSESDSPGASTFEV